MRSSSANNPKLDQLLLESVAVLAVSARRLGMPPDAQGVAMWTDGVTDYCVIVAPHDRRRQLQPTAEAAVSTADTPGPPAAADVSTLPAAEPAALPIRRGL